MRISTPENFIFEIKCIHISHSESDKKIEVAYSQEPELEEDTASVFSIDSSCFENGVKDFPAFVELVKKNLLEKGFFDFAKYHNKKVIEDTDKPSAYQIGIKGEIGFGD